MWVDEPVRVAAQPVPAEGVQQIATPPPEPLLPAVMPKRVERPVAVEMPPPATAPVPAPALLCKLQHTQLLYKLLPVNFVFFVR